MSATSVNKNVAALVTDSCQDVGDDAAMRFYVKEWRKKRRLSQDQLGQAIGLSKSAISKLEHGARQSAARHQDNICKALEITLEDLRRAPASVASNASPGAPDQDYSAAARVEGLERVGPIMSNPVLRGAIKDLLSLFDADDVIDEIQRQRRRRKDGGGGVENPQTRRGATK